jgi:class 3 adenylate cyclase
MQRSPEIEGALCRLVRCVAASDLEGVRAFRSDERGRRFIGTDPREWYVDDDMDALWDAQLPEFAAAGGVSLQILDADGFEEGSIGWGAINCLVDIGGFGEFPSRVSAVFRLERGHWRVVQIHFSAAVTNEVATGLEMTTTFDAVADSVREDRPSLGISAAPDGTVTLLFTDIEASTELAERLGDVRYTKLLRWHRAATNGAADANRGYVVKSLGDGFMIAFPSASDGIRCAIALQHSVADGWEGEPVRLRAGLHSGDAVRDLDDFYGHAVTVAARVAALADGGEIVVTRVVRELAHGGEFRFDAPRVAELKGLQGSYEIIAVKT